MFKIFGDTRENPSRLKAGEDSYVTIFAKSSLIDPKYVCGIYTNQLSWFPIRKRQKVKIVFCQVFNSPPSSSQVFGQNIVCSWRLYILGSIQKGWSQVITKWKNSSAQDQNLVVHSVWYPTCQGQLKNDKDLALLRLKNKTF